MRKRFLNQTAITGYSSIVFSLIPFFQGGAQVNITTLVLAGVGILLVLWGTIKTPNKCPSLSELTALVEMRKQYLLPLKENIHKRLSIADRFVKEASELPLSDYRQKYMRSSRFTDDPHIFVLLFYTQRFGTTNLYFKLLKDNDSEYRLLMQGYKFAYSQIKDRKLKKQLRKLWYLENGLNSLNIGTLIWKNNPSVVSLSSLYNYR